MWRFFYGALGLLWCSGLNTVLSTSLDHRRSITVEMSPFFLFKLSLKVINEKIVLKLSESRSRLK
jgi:hypothetical protein